ncbi:MAG TPA: FtsX-like permease family protein, partial [Puia sp.]|nr:FtsX-like permease family protein [Puia sp.]
MSSMNRMGDYRGDLQESTIRPGGFSTWLLLRSASDTARVTHNLTRLSLLTAEKNGGADATAFTFTASHDFSLRPLGDSHSYARGSDIYLKAFSWAAGLILLLALVNYMSLATARSAARAREVGVRKVLGAARKRIAEQFYVESAVYAAVSFVVGFLAFLWFRSYFCRLIGLQIDTHYIFSPEVLTAFGMLLLLVIIAAASYPALLLSRFRPVVVLYGKLSRQRSSELVRKGFIVIQFSLSMAMMICSFVIGKQLYFFRHTDTGVDRENVVAVPFGSTMPRVEPFEREVRAMPGILRTSVSEGKMYGYALLELVYSPGQSAPVSVTYMKVDTGFIPLLGLKWKEPPSAGMAWSDTGHLILNESAANALHLEGSATGKQVKIGAKFITVAGVLKDFNFFGMHDRVEPFSLSVIGDEGTQKGPKVGILYVKIGPRANMPAMMDKIRKAYGRYDVQTPFEYEFLDETFESTFRSEDQLARFFNLFTVITIVIGCLGLFALATFSAQQRLKEIGIRKVLGASVGSISALLSRDLLLPVLLSVFIASPVAWWLMHRWLQDFPYRTDISWWVFLAAGAGLLLVAELTVLVRTVKA